MDPLRHGPHVAVRPANKETAVYQQRPQVSGRLCQSCKVPRPSTAGSMLTFPQPKMQRLRIVRANQARARQLQAFKFAYPASKEINAVGADGCDMLGDLRRLAIARC